VVILLLLTACTSPRVATRNARWSVAPLVYNLPDSPCPDYVVVAAADLWDLEVTYEKDRAYTINVGPATQHTSGQAIAETRRYEVALDDEPLPLVIGADVELWRCDDPKIILHELGHALGWGHGPKGTIMATYLEDIGYLFPEDK